MQITEEIPLEVTVFRSRIDGRLVVEIEQATDSDEPEIRVTLNDGTIWDGSTEGPNQIRPVVLMRDGETFEGDDVDVIDITDLFGRDRSAYTTENVIEIVTRLEGAGFIEAARDIREEWGL